MPQDGQELIRAEARVSPIKYPETLSYLIARRVVTANPEPESAFVAVMEPFNTEPYITSVRRHDAGVSSYVEGTTSFRYFSWTNTAVVVCRTGGERDIVLHSTGKVKGVTEYFTLSNTPPITTDADVAIITFSSKNEPARAFFAGGSFLQISDQKLTASGLEGKITAINLSSSKLHVRLAPGSTAPGLTTLPSRVLHLSNSLRQTVHTITAATREGDELILTVKDDLRVGLVHVDSVEGTTVRSKTALRIFQIYRGTTLYNRADQPLATVLEAKDTGELTLTAPPTAKISPGDDLWMIDAAVGETVRLPAILSWTK